MVAMMINDRQISQYFSAHISCSHMCHLQKLCPSNYWAICQHAPMVRLKNTKFRSVFRIGNFFYPLSNPGFHMFKQ